MKNWLKYTASIAIGGMLCLAVISFSQEEEKPIKYVSMAMIFQDSDLKKDYEKKLNTFEEDSNAKLLKMDQAIKQKELDGADASEIGHLKRQLADSREKLSQEYQTRSQKYQEEVWSKINKSIERYGKTHNYKFILGATGDGAIMYADDAEDITKEVITYLNKIS